VQYILDSKPSLTLLSQRTVTPPDTGVERAILMVLQVDEDLKPDLADLFDPYGKLDLNRPWYALVDGNEVLDIGDDLSEMLRKLSADGHKLVLDLKTE
jgi:hypothetical protein